MKTRRRNPTQSILFSSSSSTVPIVSQAAQWHKDRRKAIMTKYGDQIRSLETSSTSQLIGLPLLIMTNLGLLTLAILSRKLSTWNVVLLSIFPGSVLSLWQLQILHDVLHGSLLDKQRTKFCGLSKRRIQQALLFWGSMPSVFGYYLYLAFGHLGHHQSVGTASVRQLFDSSKRDFEDGDILFTSHRMRLQGPIGPIFGGRTLSLSRSAFGWWKRGKVLRNASIFATSFLVERIFLVINDVFVVSLTGRNYFFPNKPPEFHQACTRYARIRAILLLLLLKYAGFSSWLFLYLSETLWSIPPHPACAMFVTNHGSTMRPTTDDDASCWPTSSTYAGAWYSFLTLGTNYHLEHHDFERIPFDKLHLLHQVAPEFYPTPKSCNLWSIMSRAFGYPDWYACTGTGVGVEN